MGAVEGDVAGLGSPAACPLRRASDGAAFLPARRKRPLWTSSISPLRFRRETIFCSARRPWWRNSSAWAISRKLAGSRARARCAITSWSVNSSSLRIGRRHCTGFAASKRQQLFPRRRVERDRPTQTARSTANGPGGVPRQGDNEEAARPGPPPFCFSGTGHAPQHPGEGTRSNEAPSASNKLGERLLGLAEMGVGSKEFIETSHLKHGLNPRIHAHKRQPASRPPARDVSLNQRPDPR